MLHAISSASHPILYTRADASSLRPSPGSTLSGGGLHITISLSLPTFIFFFHLFSQLMSGDPPALRMQMVPHRRLCSFPFVSYWGTDCFRLFPWRVFTLTPHFKIYVARPFSPFSIPGPPVILPDRICGSDGLAFFYVWLGFVSEDSR